LTYKANFDWAIDENFRLRGTRSTGFRAPEVTELFGGQFLTDPGGVDPCDIAKGGAPNGPGSQCFKDLTKAGLTPAQIATFSDPITQIATLEGGNTALQPEQSQEWTFGGIFTPKWVPGLSVTLDYYTVLIRNNINTANDPLGACYIPGATPSGLANPCAGVIRSPGTGVLSTVADPLINLGAQNTDGIDFGADYTFDTALIGLPNLGHVNLSGQGTYLLSNNTIINGVVAQEAGTYSVIDDTASPRWKAELAGTFSRDNWSTTLTERYYGGVKPDQATQQGEGTPLDGLGAEAAGVFYTDLSGTYNYKNLTVTVGVDNLFDKQPPALIGGASITQAVDGANYDFVGRFLYMKTSIKF
jgi:outer membrane receptor protein involved in Fe transport